jgi:hypothetical protein
VRRDGDETKGKRLERRRYQAQRALRPPHHAAFGRSRTAIRTPSKVCHIMIAEPRTLEKLLADAALRSAAQHLRAHRRIARGEFVEAVLKRR